MPKQLTNPAADQVGDSCGSGTFHEGSNPLGNNLSMQIGQRNTHTRSADINTNDVPKTCVELQKVGRPATAWCPHAYSLDQALPFQIFDGPADGRSTQTLAAAPIR